MAGFWGNKRDDRNMTHTKSIAETRSDEPLAPEGSKLGGREPYGQVLRKNTWS